MDILNQIQSGIESGLIRQEELEALYKGISAGYGYAGRPQDLTYGGVIQTEALETVLKSVTFEQKTLKFWPAISIDKANAMYEQYNRLLSYGSDSAPYIGEGGAPQEEDSTYVRDAMKIAFFGTRRKVSHQMTLIRTSIGDVVAQQAKEGTLHILKQLEKEMYWGSGHYVNASNGTSTGYKSDLPTNSIAMEGLLIQLQRGNYDSLVRSGDFYGYGQFSTIEGDLAGANMTQDDIEEGAVVTLENFGTPDQLHIEPLALSVFIRQFYPQFRSEPGLAKQTVGYDVSNVQTSAGKIDFKPNLFLRPRSSARSSADNANCPAITAASGLASTVSGGKLIPAATYQYKVTAVNDFGEGTPFQIAAVMGATDNTVTFTMTTVSSGTKTIKIYRSAANGSVGTETFVGNYAFVGNGMTFVDNGLSKLPGLGEVYLLDMKPEVMKFKQLAPLTKINLAVVTTALEFILVLYGALLVYSPRFNFYFKNVGKTK